MWCGVRGRVPDALARVAPLPHWQGPLRTYSALRPRLPDGASNRAAACALSAHTGESTKALHSARPSRPARAFASFAANRDGSRPSLLAASRKPSHAASSWAVGVSAGLPSCVHELLPRRAGRPMSSISNSKAVDQANLALEAMGRVSSAAKVFNDDLDPMARTMPPPPALPVLLPASFWSLLPRSSLRHGFAWKQIERAFERAPLR
jgi:hypothetical protein